MRKDDRTAKDAKDAKKRKRVFGLPDHRVDGDFLKLLFM
jgi:hypothetical protein